MMDKNAGEIIASDIGAKIYVDANIEICKISIGYNPVQGLVKMILYQTGEKGFKYTLDINPKDVRSLEIALYHARILSQNSRDDRSLNF